MKDEEIVKLLARKFKPTAFDPFIGNEDQQLLAIQGAERALEGLRSHGLEVLPVEPGIGFFDAVERALSASYEKDGQDQMTDVFRHWNKARAMISPTSR